MTLHGLDQLGILLAEATAMPAFSASLMTPVSDLNLEVRGVGPIDVPVSSAQARQLCLLGREARYGRGEQTVVDRQVRDTWQVPKSRVKIDKRQWNQTLRPVLDRLGRDLGVPSGRRLTANLHSMLVYGPGQFFVPHQDSEKDDAMVASLVVGLPSTFSGGTLEVRHAGRTATYRGSKKSLSFVAFYSDCRHEIKPVTSGYRVVLTYNLMLRDDPGASTVDPDSDSEFADSVGRWLEEHFDASGADRFIYLLDHEYTRRGLDWSRLKGVDSRRGKLLATAAERAGCNVTLALADVHETWTAYEPERNRRSGYRQWDDWDNDVRGDPADDYELEDFIESSITLDSWIEPGRGRLQTVRLPVSDDEVCASTPSGDLQPHRSEYEGYMGNWGNTLDRWYHRGAVLVWRRSREFALRAEASPSWALDELTARARRGDVIGAREAAGELVPFWDRVAGATEAKGFFSKAVRTALVVDDPSAARLLLRPLSLDMLADGHAQALSALVETYGEPWAAELVAAWSERWRSHQHQAGSVETWLATSRPLLLALRDAGDAGTAFAAVLIRESWKWLSRRVDQGRALTSPSRSEQAMSDLGPAVAAILDGASLVGARDVRDEVVGVLRHGDVGVCAMAVLRATAPERWAGVGLDAVAAACSAALEARLARPSRRSDDWSIELPDGCACELCTELRAFLLSPDRTGTEWPLAKNRRAHVHARIDVAEIAVRHQTRRVGRPYTLVLTKGDALFAREAQRRRSDERDLEWLERCPTGPG